jgi:hypothetical protein
MGIKDFFFINENPEEKKEPEVAPTYTNKFPTSNPAPSIVPAFTSQNQIPQPVAPNCEPYLNKVMEMYEKGFENLNQPGYDFFEFFKTISVGDKNNPSTYVMAYNMAKVMDASVNKENLISQADFYVNEITKVYNEYVNAGNSKKQDALAIQTSEKQSLSKELEDLNKQAAEISAKISAAKNNLENIASKHQPKIDEIDCKLMANEVAKKTILDSINIVKSGIQNNLN